MLYLLHAKSIEIKSRLAGDEGATAVEYGVMVALIIAVIIAIVATIGTEVSEGFESVNNELST